MNLANIKESAICWAKRTLFSRGIEVQVTETPLYTFAGDEVEYNLDTTNNMIKTPKGYFRICFEHLPREQYLQQLSELYRSVPESQRPAKGESFFLRKGLRDWKFNSNKYKYQTYNACSSMAEEKVARLLGIDRLLTHSYFCRVKVDGRKEIVGTMASFAKGVGVQELKDNYQEVFTPELVKELSNLNIIDVICYEKDHRPDNYHIVLDKKGRAVSICSFDNDTSWSFSPYGSAMFKTYSGASAFVKNGVINRPLLDNDVCCRLLNLTQYDIENNLNDFIEENQVKACWRRIKTIQQAIKNTHFQHDQWDDEIMKLELSGNWGKTYYSILWNRCVAIKKNNKNSI